MILFLSILGIVAGLGLTYLGVFFFVSTTIKSGAWIGLAMMTVGFSGFVAGVMALA